MLDINVNIENIPITDENVTSIANNLLNSTGVADIVNSVSTGSTDDIIASSITAVNNLTSTAGLTSLADQMQNISQQIADMSFSMADQAIDQCLDAVFVLITEFFNDTGVLDVILKGMEIANTTIDAAKLGLNITAGAANVTANVIKLADEMCILKDMNVTCIPDPKETIKMKTAIAGQMIKEIIIAQYNNAKQLLLDLKNSLICTSNDAVIDNVIASVNAILDFVQPLVDPYLAEYTGYTVANVRILCNTGFQYINMITRSVALAKALKAQAEDQMQEVEINDNPPAENETKEQEKERKKKERAAKSKAAFDKHKKDLSKEEAKAKLMEWLQQQNILLQNAFYLVMVKNLITDIQVQCQKLLNSGIESMVDFLNTIDMVFKLFELFGYQPGKEGIKVNDIIELASILGATALLTATNVSDLITANSRNAINQNIQNGRNAASSAVNQAKSQASSAASSLQNQANNIVQDQSETYNGEVYSAAIEYNSDNITINMTIYANPEINSALLDYLKTFKQGNGKAVFNNIKIKTIKDNILDAWDDEEDMTFEVSAKTDGVTKKYIFNITIDSEQYKQWNKDKNEAAKENAKNAVADTVNNNIDQALDAAIKEGEKSLEALKNSISQLANVNINIDMTLLNGYFKDKVIMFDCIVKLLDALYPVYQILKMLAHLLENYKINKEFVKSGQRVSIADAAKTISLVYNNLKDIIDLKNTNFFPVRTEGMSKFVQSTFGMPNPDGTLTVDIEGTYKLYDYCLLNIIIPQPELSMIKGTTFYFEIDKDGTYKDGTLEGLDNVDYNEEFQEVYYDSKHRSTVASQIMRAKTRGEDPHMQEIKAIGSEKSSDFSDFFKTITVQSDEFEGQQTINIDNMYCCPAADLYEIIDEPEFYEVIEFADEYTNGEAINYTWNVKPGDNVTESTILAYIYKNGQDIPVKSIYSKGKVMETSNHDFRHLYPDSCNRHICLCDTSIGNPTDFDYTKVLDIMNKMADSDVVFNLMMNNMIKSMAPVVLANANRPEEKDDNGNIVLISTVDTQFGYAIKDYDKAIQAFAEQISDMSSADNVKGNISDLSGLGDLIISFKNNQMYAYIKDKYNELLNAKYRGNSNYSDCKNLATDCDYVGNIGDGDYNNYYMQLIANIDLNIDNKYVKDYYNLIKDIIDNRISKEEIDVQELKNQFNTLFNQHLYHTNDAYNEIDGKITDPTFKSVKALIRSMTLQNIMYTSAKTEKYNDTQTYKEAFKELEETHADAEKYYALYDKLEQHVYNDKDYEYTKYDGPIKLLSNIYLTIKNVSTVTKNISIPADKKLSKVTNLNKITKPEDISEKYKNLIIDESNKIKNFWNNLISKYENELSFNNTKKALTDYINGIGQYAEWPQGVDITIGSDVYKLYTFMNRETPDVEIPDLLAGNMENTDIPDATIDYTQIADINGPGKITMMDYLYWVVYMTNATLFTLIPLYWADGFDVPPYMTPTPMPAIYFPIAPPVNIPIINVTLVIGLAIRGIWFMPILLIVNQNSLPINVVFPAIVALLTTKQIFERTLSTIETGIPRLIDSMLNNLSSENAELKKDLDKFRTYASIFRSIPIEDKALIEEEFKAAVYDALENFKDAKEKRKAAREQKKRDKRQVITREENLGEGLDPL